MRVWQPLFRGGGGHYDFGYTPADSERVSLLQGASTGTSAAKSVTIAAKIGDTISIDFFADGTGSGSEQFSQVIDYKIEVKPLVATVDLVAGSLTRNKNGDAKFAYQVSGQEDLQRDASVSFYWATGPNYADRVGDALFTAPVEKGRGSHSVMAPASSLVNLPFTLSPTPRLLATHLIAVLDPDGAVAETSEGNNVGHQVLPPLTIGADFLTTFTRGDGRTYNLNQDLLNRTMRLLSHAIAQNLVTGVTLNEGLRSPAKAHRWSTAYSIRHGDVSLASLKALPEGKDKDGNVWYDPAWAVGLPAGQAGRDSLWRKIRNNAARVANKSNPDAIAAEGYDDDEYRAPNTYTKISNHCKGLAMDVGIQWRAGAKVNGQAITNGQLTDAVVNKLVKSFDLKRPVSTERWHFEGRSPLAEPNPLP